MEFPENSWTDISSKIRVSVDLLGPLVRGAGGVVADSLGFLKRVEKIGYRGF